MGNKCYNADNYDKYHYPEIDEPSSVYAVEMVDPKDLPCDLGSIHSQYGHESIDQTIKNWINRVGTSPTTHSK